jgi:hypothetical protein
MRQYESSSSIDVQRIHAVELLVVIANRVLVACSCRSAMRERGVEGNARNIQNVDGDEWPAHDGTFENLDKIY